MSRKWEKKYKNYINDENLSEIEIGKLMEQYRPGKLYRYMRFDDYWEKNIFEGQAFLSEASKLNDPFDCLVYIDHDTFSNHMFQMIYNVFPNTERKLLHEISKLSIESKLDEYLYSMKSHFRVACFTENNDSPLMWAHYTDNHKGFCMEYNLDKLPEGYRYGILPVIYSDQRYDATKAVIAQNKNLVTNPFYFKSSYWEYEKEWRMMIPESIVKDNEYYADFYHGISGIYLGLRSFEYHMEKIDRIIEKYSQRNIPVHKITIEPFSYCMKPIQIN